MAKILTLIIMFMFCLSNSWAYYLDNETDYSQVEEPGDWDEDEYMEEPPYEEPQEEEEEHDYEYEVQELEDKIKEQGYIDSYDFFTPHFKEMSDTLKTARSKAKCYMDKYTDLMEKVRDGTATSDNVPDFMEPCMGGLDE